MNTAIRFEQVFKRYRVVRQKPFLARELLYRFLRRRTRWEFHQALSGISFDIRHGESVGVIGVNGSGKSTLLSLIARTSYPTQGLITVSGKVGPLLELGAGFHPDLTGYENIYLNASLLGLTRKQVEERLDSIVDFAELHDFIHSPLKSYSTGMRARLGFAVIAHIDPEILLIDEVLSVGDGQFQTKCERTMDALRTRGVTLVVVSHSMDTVLRLCRRCMWIHEGRLHRDGPTEEVVASYREFLSGSRPASTGRPAPRSELSGGR